jgi:hypothetical protein
MSDSERVTAKQEVMMFSARVRASLQQRAQVADQNVNCYSSDGETYHPAYSLRQRNGLKRRSRIDIFASDSPIERHSTNEKGQSYMQALEPRHDQNCTTMDRDAMFRAVNRLCGSNPNLGLGKYPTKRLRRNASDASGHSLGRTAWAMINCGSD